MTDCPREILRLGVTREWVGEGELPRERKKKSEMTEALRCYLYLLKGADKSEDEAEGIEADGRKGRGSDDESGGAQLPKSKASVRKEVDSEERHNATEVDLSIAKKRT
ncbi:hypothetical protein BHM03_00060473 [Ensete ventricosum]|nr:hypothetical protein BHM03_00060473 [Ensete ventricosum]